MISLILLAIILAVGFHYYRQLNAADTEAPHRGSGGGGGGSVDTPNEPDDQKRII